MAGLHQAEHGMRSDEVRFSMDKPGWRIHAALKQNHRCEESP